MAIDAKQGLWIIGGSAVAIVAAIGAGLYFAFRKPGLGGLEENELLARAAAHCAGKPNFRDCVKYAMKHPELMSDKSTREVLNAKLAKKRDLGESSCGCSR